MDGAQYTNREIFDALTVLRDVPSTVLDGRVYEVPEGGVQNGLTLIGFDKEGVAYALPTVGGIDDTLLKTYTHEQEEHQITFDLSLCRHIVATKLHTEEFISDDLLSTFGVRIQGPSIDLRTLAGYLDMDEGESFYNEISNALESSSFSIDVGDKDDEWRFTVRDLAYLAFIAPEYFNDELSPDFSDQRVEGVSSLSGVATQTEIIIGQKLGIKYFSKLLGLVAWRAFSERQYLHSKEDMMSLQVEAQEEDNGEHKFTLIGDLDASNVGIFRQALQTILKSKPASIILDFDAVEFLDSTGIGAVIQTYKQMNKAGGSFRLTGMKGQPLQTFKFLKLNHLIEAS